MATSTATEVILTTAEAVAAQQPATSAAVVGAGDAVDLMRSLAYAIGMTLLRLLILLTSPISVPILATFALHANRRVVEARERLHAETLNSLRSLQQKDPS